MTSLQRRLLKAVDEREADLVSLARDLVRIPSVNHPPSGDEGRCQEFIASWLASAGIPARMLRLDEAAGLQSHEAFLPGRDYRGRPNVLARVEGSGGGRSLLLSGHVDTMEVGDDSWKHDPFGGDIEGGRLYGRGSWDMKGGLAAMMFTLRLLREMGVRLKGDLLFESVVDEEHAGCNGTLADRLAGHNAEAIILPEPTNFKLCHAHKGFRIVHLALVGKPGMSFGGEEVLNPVEFIGPLVEILQAFRKKRQRDTSIPGAYASDPDPVPVMLPKLQAGEFSYRVPMQLPRECKIEVYWQTMPGETREQVEKEFFDFLRLRKEADPRLREVEVRSEFSHRWMPGTQAPREHPLVKTVEQAATSVLGKAPDIGGAPFPCDLFIFHQYGFGSGVVFGPDGANAHGPDEFVSVPGLVRLTKIMALTIMAWCGVKE